MTRDFFVGLLFLLAIVLLTTMTMMVSGFGSMSQNLHSVTFNQISGLSAGDPIRWRGARIGEVDVIHVPTAVSVQVDLRFDDPEFRPVEGPLPVFRIRALSLLGGNYVEYAPDPADAPPPDGAPLRGTGGSDLVFELGETLRENRESLRKIVAGVDAAVTAVNAQSGILGTLIHNRELTEDFSQIIDNVRQATDQLARGQGVAGKLLNDPELSAALDRVPAVIENLEQISSKLNSSHGPLGALINDQEMRIQLEQVFEDVAERRGLLGRIIGDSELADEFEALVREARSFSQNLNEGSGVVQALLGDPELRDRFTRTVVNLEEISAKINGGQGTIGRLVNDDSLYRDAQTTLVQVRDATEDAREQAPVNAFLNALFSAF